MKYDPDCVTNLAGKSDFAEVQTKLEEEMERRLREQEDPRMFGKGHLFDEYKMTNGNFYNEFMAGKQPNAGWVIPTDFEKEPLK